MNTQEYVTRVSERAANIMVKYPSLFYVARVTQLMVEPLDKISEDERKEMVKHHLLNSVGLRTVAASKVAAVDTLWTSTLREGLEFLEKSVVRATLTAYVDSSIAFNPNAIKLWKELTETEEI